MKDRAQESMERLLRDAGIGAGMRVLDVGCGHGGVSSMIAGLVGSTGSVVGLDRDPTALAFARARMEELGTKNVSFVEGDLGLPPQGEVFDAIVGRRVLMYVADKKASMRGLVGALRPGGVAVFQEVDASMTPISNVPLPLHRRVHDWIWQTVKHEGATPSMGFELAPLLEGAGLVVEDIRAECIVQTPSLRYVTAAIVRGILPRIVAAGVATEAELDVETLEERMMKELSDTGATFIGDVFFGAWAHRKAA